MCVNSKCSKNRFNLPQFKRKEVHCRYLKRNDNFKCTIHVIRNVIHIFNLQIHIYIIFDSSKFLNTENLSWYERKTSATILRLVFFFFRLYVYASFSSSLHQVTPPTPRETFSSTMATEAVLVTLAGSWWRISTPSAGVPNGIKSPANPTSCTQATPRRLTGLPVNTWVNS